MFIPDMGHGVGIESHDLSPMFDLHLCASETQVRPLDTADGTRGGYGASVHPRTAGEGSQPIPWWQDWPCPHGSSGKQQAIRVDTLDCVNTHPCLERCLHVGDSALQDAIRQLWCRCRLDRGDYR